MKPIRLARQLCGKLLGLLLGGLLLSSCGGSSGDLVIVQVSGLASTITELYVTMQLDGTTARNTNPQHGASDMAFFVYDDMQRFGVQVPDGTQVLSLNIIGYDTSLVVVRMGSGMLSLAQGKELDITLAAP
jgi:hypothetical protein